MKDFEKALRDLPKPVVPTEEFKRGLHAELSRAVRRRAGSGYRLRFGLATAAAAIMAVTLGVFVLQPDIPAQLHIALGGASPQTEHLPRLAAPAATNAMSQQVQALFQNSSATADLDRSAVDDWYQQRALPVGVGEMEGERIYAVRQFRLTNGERIVVFSELGQDSAQPSLSF